MNGETDFNSMVKGILTKLDIDKNTQNISYDDVQGFDRAKVVLKTSVRIGKFFSLSNNFDLHSNLYGDFVILDLGNQIMLSIPNMDSRNVSNFCIARLKDNE